MTVRPVVAYHTDTVRIRWTLENGKVYYHDVTCPPKPTLEAKNAAGQVVDRTEENGAGQKM